ncbi:MULTISPECIES: hypothetical protein [Aeribacillus]|uniref:hypothetical protein n=1 Tax=Aeribacillus TaxID=1055323 RepID=UPI000E348D55|nr:hypothetical protein [Aeribacillus pallidus]RZI51026.1 hypothetical protein EW027_12230 [Aeribacillus pallidus]
MLKTKEQETRMVNSKTLAMTHSLYQGERGILGKIPAATFLDNMIICSGRRPTGRLAGFTCHVKPSDPCFYQRGKFTKKFGLNRLLYYMLSKAFHIKIPSMSFLFSVNYIIRAVVKFFIVQ